MKFTLYTEEMAEEERENEKAQDTEEVNESLTLERAYMKCLESYGRIDMKFLTESTGKSVGEVAQELDLVQDPSRFKLRRDPMADWVKASDYLSNTHIPRLYKEAEEMEEKYPGMFVRNLKLLEEQYPKLTGLTPYDFGPGNPLVPPFVIAEILKTVLELRQIPDVRFHEDTGRFTVCLVGEEVNQIVDRVKYGTEKKPFSKAMEAILNGDEIIVKDKVYGTDGKDRYVRNEQETMLFLNRMQAFIREYYHVLGELLQDSEIYEALCKRYCDSIGGYVRNKVRQCESNWVHVEGVEDILRDYQKDGGVRVLTNPATLLNWGTGDGKALGLLAAAQLLKRFNISQKILIIMPNSNLENFLMETEKFFPDGNYLPIYPASFSNKKASVLKLIEEHGDEYDAILMPISVYRSIDMSKKYYCDQIDQKIRTTRKALQEEQVKKVLTSNRSLLKRRLNDLRDKRTQILNTPDTIMNCFEKLGIDALFIDECQEFKNLTLTSGYGSIAGVTTTGSAKCNRNLEKVHWVLRERKDGREGRVVFSTATPQKNSISETYVYQKYLQESELAYIGIQSLKDWIRYFAEVQTSAAVGVDLQKMTLQNRLKYHNLTDLHSMVASFMHFHRVDPEQYKGPEKGGYTRVVIPSTEQEREAFLEIGRKLESFKNGEMDAAEYNTLMALQEGRAISLDIRHVYPDAVPPKGTTKSEYVSARAYQIYVNYPGTTQLIFCDQSIPQQGFNVYTQIRKHLMEYGIPNEEIAFIQDAQTPVQKKKLINDFRQAKVRILIGSTQRCGTGLNIQKKLIALHHVDCPWSPASLIQRNGRMYREGNENSEVFNFLYLKEDSYDAFSFDRLQMKMKWIEEFNTPYYSEEYRDMEQDLADNSLSYGEALALAIGKPEMKYYIERSNDLKRTVMEARRRACELQKMKKLMVELPKSIERRERYVSVIEEDMAHYRRHRVSMSEDARNNLGREILEAIFAAKENLAEKVICVPYKGFDVLVPTGFEEGEEPYVKLQGSAGIYKVKMVTEKPLGCVQILDNYLGVQLEKIRKRHEARGIEERRSLGNASREIAKGNTYQVKAEMIRKELEELEKDMENGAA